MANQYEKYRETIKNQYESIAIGDSNMLAVCDNFYKELISIGNGDDKISFRKYCQYLWPMCYRWYSGILSAANLLGYSSSTRDLLYDTFNSVFSIGTAKLAEKIRNKNFYITADGNLTIIPFNVKIIASKEDRQLLNLGKDNGIKNCENSIFVRVKRYKNEFTDLASKDLEIKVNGNDDRGNSNPWNTPFSVTPSSFIPVGLLSNLKDGDTVEYTETIPVTVNVPNTYTCYQNNRENPFTPTPEIGTIVIHHKHRIKQNGEYLWRASNITELGFIPMNDAEFAIANSFEKTLDYILKKFPDRDAVIASKSDNIGLVRSKIKLI